MDSVVRSLHSVIVGADSQTFKMQFAFHGGGYYAIHKPARFLQDHGPRYHLPCFAEHSIFQKPPHNPG